MPEHEPERRCILTGQHDARDALIRLALGPDGQVLPDLGARAPGRGAWVVSDRATLSAAQAKGKLRGALARAFKTSAITLPEDLVQCVEEGLKRRALDRMGLENRAGHLILGSDRILDAIAAGRVRLLLHAADAAADGMEKLDGRLRRVEPRAKAVILPVARAELSLALGRENVVHAAVSDQAAADRVAAAVERWRAFCGLKEWGEPQQPVDGVGAQ